MFIDKAQITIKAGNGGNGCCSFRREAFIPKGGPNGGDGGNGGNVVFVAAPGEQTLQDFLYTRRFTAENGIPGKSKDMHGRRGKDLKIKDTPDKEVVVAYGGKGGRGNTRFATSVNRAPREHEPGEKTEPIPVELELKMIADAGLVGFPNAGKSTLLSAISNAKPKVAPYPFTTRHPVVGVVEYPDFRTLLMADVPGLLDGAHRNVGLGHSFLRHIERTKILIYVLDMAGVDGRNPCDDLKTLKKELELYMKDLSRRASLIIANKMDLPESAENLKLLRKKVRGIPIVPISAATDRSFDTVRNAIRAALEKRIADESRHGGRKN